MQIWAHGASSACVLQSCTHAAQMHSKTAKQFQRPKPNTMVGLAMCIYIMNSTTINSCAVNLHDLLAAVPCSNNQPCCVRGTIAGAELLALKVPRSACLLLIRAGGKWVPKWRSDKWEGQTGPVPVVATDACEVITRLLAWLKKHEPGWVDGWLQWE
jgi:hypothetical protein